MKGCRPLTDAEIAGVLAALERDRFHARNRALVVLGCRSGFRISELLSIRIGDVWRGGKITEEVEVARSHMKGKRESRQIPLHAEARAALALWVRELEAAGRMDPSLPLFPSGQDPAKPLNRRSAWKLLKRAYRHCDLSGKLATHTLRKTFARRMRAATGGDLLKVMELLGHRELETTQKYLENVADDLRDAILKS